MVIINTRAVEVSIQAVSPELILSVPINVGSVGAAAAASAGAGAAASGAEEAGAADAAVGASSAPTAGTDSVSKQIKANRAILVINANLPEF
jgi:hypothetical protein